MKARIRTDLAREMFAEAFGQPAADARELSGFLARASRQETTAVAGYDLTFSPVKSVSALWAIAPRQLAEQIEAAHHAAVADTLRWLESQVAYTRTGRGGARQVETTGIVAAAFTHRDSRSGDPDLHTHVALSNKVQTGDGRWLALDGRVLFKANVSLSERYNTRLEAEMRDRVGVAFAERVGQDASKRAVREIVGVEPALNEYWSSRRAVIDARRAELAAQFQAEHHRPPTEIEALALAQQATLETRPGKHEPRSFAEQRAAWRHQAIQVLGSPGAVARRITAATHGDRGPGLAFHDNLTLSIATGPANISAVDCRAEKLTASSDGTVVRTLPTSCGKATTPTYTGAKVVMQKGEDVPGTNTLRPNGAVRMISNNPAEPYDLMVPWSVRITNSGEYVHAASWNGGNIGVRSNGCTNLNVTDAEWFYKFARIGDIVTCTNTGGTRMPSWDGFGDWNVPWPLWQAGGAVSS